ncbi:hypothetical protein CPC08DRAFT_366659 [Agrocybe pediades]|nr:hypothetical protein CPC08DRAFT_366659 [Agrocybe pediades]
MERWREGDGGWLFCYHYITLRYPLFFSRVFGASAYNLSPFSCLRLGRRRATYPIACCSAPLPLSSFASIPAFFLDNLLKVDFCVTVCCAV